MSKWIIAGGRDIDVTIAYNKIKEFFKDKQLPIIVISGGAKGVDNAGELFAEQYGAILYKYEADWKTHGPAAGPIRNRQMAERGHRLLLIWDGKSRGSASMKREMLKLNKPVDEIILERI